MLLLELAFLKTQKTFAIESGVVMSSCVCVLSSSLTVQAVPPVMLTPVSFLFLPACLPQSFYYFPPTRSLLTKSFTPDG